jgi:hypothetical protein
MAPRRPHSPELSTVRTRQHHFESLSDTMTIMSIKVSLTDLPTELPKWGFGFLVTASDDGASHVISLIPDISQNPDGEVRLRLDAGGGRACRNVPSQPTVTIVFPPLPNGDGFSLLVDGKAVVDGDVVEVTPTGAVLHRPAPALPGLRRVDWGTEGDYRAGASRDGFLEPMSRSYTPDSDSPLHDHDTVVRGLVVSGTFVLRMANGDESFESGESFELASGTLHVESSSESGATVLLALR